ncbi:hypothetical protein R1U54_000182 [Vibrio fluvialis]|nr:hypothetical protein [Vibrio fluvialis]ELP2650129.1 hypothetical protein [Vibrio fluvialis]
MNVANIFITGYSLNLTEISTEEDFNDALDQLENFFENGATYNNVEVCNDYLTYDLGGETLRDLIYEISGFSDPQYTELLKELSYVVRGKVQNTLSDVALASSGAGPVWNGEFIGFYSQGKIIPLVLNELIVTNSDSLFELNYKNLGVYPISEKSFSDRAQLIFDNISYHHNFESTLSTVVSGDFKSYSIEFARSLKILHDSFPKLTSKGHNPPDLDIIRCESGIAGRAMDCTVQGSNKALLCNKSFDIKLIDGKQHHIASLNCEYHLKINHDNNGKRLSKRFYNRAYFGLPLINGKKYIALYHLGKHY